MKINALIVAFTLTCFSAAFAADKEDGTYYQTLKSLLGPKQLHARLTNTDDKVNLLTAGKGGGGVSFGQTMEDVIKLWGKPHAIQTGSYGPGITALTIGSSNFTFRDNKLVTIALHRNDLPNARFQNGISFKSNLAEAKKILGKSVVENHGTYWFEHGEGCFIKLQFYTGINDKPELIAMVLTSPGSASHEQPEASRPLDE